MSECIEGIVKVEVFEEENGRAIYYCSSKEAILPYRKIVGCITENCEYLTKIQIPRKVK